MTLVSIFAACCHFALFSAFEADQFPSDDEGALLQMAKFAGASIVHDGFGVADDVWSETQPARVQNCAGFNCAEAGVALARTLRYGFVNPDTTFVPWSTVAPEMVNCPGQADLNCCCKESGRVKYGSKEYPEDPTAPCHRTGCRGGGATDGVVTLDTCYTNNRPFCPSFSGLHAEPQNASLGSPEPQTCAGFNCAEAGVALASTLRYGFVNPDTTFVPWSTVPPELVTCPGQPDLNCCCKESGRVKYGSKEYPEELSASCHRTGCRGGGATDGVVTLDTCYTYNRPFCPDDPLPSLAPRPTPPSASPGHQTCAGFNCAEAGVALASTLRYGFVNPDTTFVPWSTVAPELVTCPGQPDLNCCCKESGRVKYGGKEYPEDLTAPCHRTGCRGGGATDGIVTLDTCYTNNRPFCPGDPPPSLAPHCDGGGLFMHGRCWYLSNTGANCSSTCEMHERQFSHFIAADSDPMVPKLVGHPIGTKQYPWKRLECYVPGQDRYHTATGDVGSDAGTWWYPTCQLACPCSETTTTTTTNPCHDDGLFAHERCWYLSSTGANCSSTCKRHARQFSHFIAADSDPMVPKLVGHPIRTKQYPWKRLECYVPGQDRYHTATGDVGSDAGTWWYPSCQLACPCSKATGATTR